MPPITEEKVERFVRYPLTLSSEEREEAARLLREDPVAQQLAEFYRTFYEELDGLADEPPVERRPTSDDGGGDAC